MRKQLFRFILLYAIYLSVPMVASAQAVSIPDFNLRAVIANKLDRALGATITVEDMARIINLDGTNQNIRNLTGLEHATNLIRLWLPENSITDLRPLLGLTHLTELDLFTNAISDISPLAGLTQLRYLNLGENRIFSISVLRRLTELEELGLWTNSISNISPIARLTKLRLLDLGENRIYDISALAGLVNLSELWLNNNFISNLSPLVANRGLGRGDTLDVDRNPLNHASINSHIPTLRSRGITVQFQSIRVQRNAVNIPDPNLRNAIEHALRKARGATITLANMQTLEVLYAGNANIRNLTGLETATNLRELGLEANGISDLSPIAGLTNLRFLHLRNNAISNISLLAGLTRLTFLHIGLNRISDISHLAGLTQLTALGAGDNEITDISSLARLPNLARIGLHNNFIFNISPLAGLTQLTELHLHKNAISDISALAGLTDLTLLYLGHNAITDLSPLVANTGLGNGDKVIVKENPLNALSFSTHIPALQSRGVNVEFDQTVAQPADVNGDGVVNIFDLVSVVSQFGEQGQNLAADVNSDGVVNIFDLVVIAGSFEEGAAAPPAQLEVPETLSAVEVHGWLTDARSLDVRDPIMERGIMVLEQLLISLTPTETRLLPNYPNPFNPETWIPYRLAEDAFVTLTIYDSAGQAVRTIDVGHQTAAVYESRSKAIYWDGRNQVGETVASGVYFYHLSAGRSGLSVPHRSDYSATRKMLILK